MLKIDKPKLIGYMITRRTLNICSRTYHNQKHNYNKNALNKLTKTNHIKSFHYNVRYTI